MLSGIYREHTVVFVRENRVQFDVLVIFNVNVYVEHNSILTSLWHHWEEYRLVQRCHRHGRRSVGDGGDASPPPPLFRVGGQHGNCPPPPPHFSVQKNSIIKSV